MKITTIPQIYRNVNRWREILGVLSKYGLADWLSQFDLEFPKGWLKDRDGEALARHTRENRIRLALTELGPTFIKLGQILSTRPDVIGVELASELEKLMTTNTIIHFFQKVEQTIIARLYYTICHMTQMTLYSHCVMHY